MSEETLGFMWQVLWSARITVAVAVCGMAVAMILGLLAANARLSKHSGLRGVATLYTSVVRGIPDLVQLLLIYYTGTEILQWISSQLGGPDRIDINQFVSGFVVLGIIYGAYTTEVFRGALLAVPKGQIEAAQACGMNRWQVLHRVVIPQVWRFALPGLGNVWLVLLKATAIISVIGLNEMTFTTLVAGRRMRDMFFFFSFAALIYLVLTIISFTLLKWVESRAARGARMT